MTSPRDFGTGAKWHVYMQSRPFFSSLSPPSSFSPIISCRIFLSRQHGSVRTIREAYLPPLDISVCVSQPSSQPSSAQPSPPGSPDSISSFPSLSLSFFFSAAASPPRAPIHIEQDRKHSQGLIAYFTRGSSSIDAVWQDPWRYSLTRSWKRRS